jgi:crotonobetainyl-CoA:carnitine CoA-transferase CaiB-like acyl-CoA transferase
MPVSAIDYVSGYLMAFGAMVALRRRATEGGSWHVRVGLARVGKWIFDHGRVPAADRLAVPPELSDDEITRFCQETPSPAGLIRHLAPVAEMSATPPRWTHPPVMPGSHVAEWIQR